MKWFIAGLALSWALESSRAFCTFLFWTSFHQGSWVRQDPFGKYFPPLQTSSAFLSSVVLLLSAHSWKVVDAFPRYHHSSKAVFFELELFKVINLELKLSASSYRSQKCFQLLDRAFCYSCVKVLLRYDRLFFSLECLCSAHFFECVELLLRYDGIFF